MNNLADYTQQIFELLGVEPEEEFKLKSRNGRQLKAKFKIYEDLDILYNEDKNCDWLIGEEKSRLLEILTGEYEIIKIPHPTTEEQLAIDYARACGYKWLAKDKSKIIWAFIVKPKKSEDVFGNKTIGAYDDDSGAMQIEIPISFISWEDEEPFYIGD